MAAEPVLKCKRHVGNEQPRIDVPVAQGSDDGFRHKRQMEARKFERAVVRRQAQRVPPPAPVFRVPRVSNRSTNRKENITAKKFRKSKWEKSVLEN